MVGTKFHQLTAQEQQEILLTYFTGMLDTMHLEDAMALRDHLSAFPQRPDLDTIIEVLGGHVALRRMG